MNNQSTIQEESIKQFFTETNIEVDSDFIDQFLYNRTHKDNVSSEWLYAWYKSTGYKQSYRNFNDRVIKQLPQSEVVQQLQDNQIIPKQQRGNGFKQKIIYSITQLGVRLVMMQCDDKVRHYYAKCEQILQQFFDAYYAKSEHIINEQRETIIQQDLLIKKATTKCFIYRIDIYDIEGKFVEFQYIGSTENIAKRKAEHKKGSSNKYVRQYIEQGRKVKFIKLSEFTHICKSERLQIEQRFIDLMDPSKKLNINNPIKSEQEQEQVIIVSQEQIQQQQPEVEDLSQETYNNYKQSVDNLKVYLDSNNNVYPVKRSIDEQQAKMGAWVVNTRVYKNDPRSQEPINKRNIEYLLQQIPDFIWDDIEHKFNTKVIELAKYLQDNNQIYPQSRGNSVTDQSKYLCNFVQRLRSSQKENGLKSPINMPQHRIEYVKTTIPNFKWIA